MTKLEELKAALDDAENAAYADYYAACGAYDAADDADYATALIATLDAAGDAYVDAAFAYYTELKKQKENSK